MQSKCGKTCTTFLGAVFTWWNSQKMQTLRVVSLGHFQLMSSILGSFPELNVQTAAAKASPVAPAAEISNMSNSSTPDAYVKQFKLALNDAADKVSNLNIEFIDQIACFIGSRHFGRLVYPTVTAIALLLVADIVPRIFRRATRGKRITQHAANLVAQIRIHMSRAQLKIIFLVYPALTMTVMRTFVCKEFAQDDQGNPTQWLVDDTTIQCEMFTAHDVIPTNMAAAAAAPYAFLFAYSWLMVIVVVIGFPALLLYKLWAWRYPFDRMYIIDEDGRENPTPEALKELSSIMIFRAKFWFMVILDMFFKFVIVSCIGVMFQSYQVAGACMAVLCCALIMGFFAFFQPYLDNCGNQLAVVSYGSLLAAFISALTDKMEGDGYEGHFVNVHFKRMLFVTWLLPYVLALIMAAGVPHYLMNIVNRYRRRRCCSKAGSKNAKLHQIRTSTREEEKYIKRVNSAFTSEHKRGLYILTTIESLLPIVRKVIHAARTYAKHVRKTATSTTAKVSKSNPKRLQRKQSNQRTTFKPWDENKDGAATLAVAEALNGRLHSMIQAFSNGGGGKLGVRGGEDPLGVANKFMAVRSGGNDGENDGGNDADAQARVRSLTGNYRPLYWHHFIDVENAACKLSEIAFPHTDRCAVKAKNEEKGKLGFIRKSFAKRHLLCEKSVMKQLQRIQEETRAAKAVSTSNSWSILRRAVQKGSGGEKKKKDDSVCGKYAHPSITDIITWREVIVAMLKPKTDFGWHKSHEAEVIDEKEGVGGAGEGMEGGEGINEVGGTDRMEREMNGIDITVEGNLSVDGKETKTALRLGNLTAETNIEIDVNSDFTHEELSTPQTPRTRRHEELSADMKQLGHAALSTHMEWAESECSRSFSEVGDHMESDDHTDSDEY